MVTGRAGARSFTIKGNDNLVVPGSPLEDSNVCRKGRSVEMGPATFHFVVFVAQKSAVPDIPRAE